MVAQRAVNAWLRRGGSSPSAPIFRPIGEVVSRKIFNLESPDRNRDGLFGAEGKQAEPPPCQGGDSEGSTRQFRRVLNS